MTAHTESSRAPALLATAPHAAEGAHAVDVWLRVALTSRYDPVLAEALPPDLLAVLSMH